MPNILVVDDNINTRRLFEVILTQNNFVPLFAADCRQASDILQSATVDLIILDVMLPGTDGFEFARLLRREGTMLPILMITAKDAFDDMQMGFRSGTDDYMVKPINVNEMVLRVGALLRRAQMITERKLTIGGTVMECDSMTVIHDGASSVLPQKEFMLLYKMASFPGKIFTRQQLMDEIWGYESGTDSHTVDVHIGRLRGVGYKVVKQ